jgi:4'-phosphopantetheinyl transferase
LITVYHTRFDGPFSENIWATLLRLLPEQEQARVMRFRKWEDRHRSLLGKLLLQKALFQLYADDDYTTQVLYTRYGRPYLSGGPDFNISHSGDIVVCACTEQGKAGIDIEKVSYVDLDVFQQMFTRREWDDIKNAPEQQLRFYHYWTLKESVIKADGRGFSVPLQELVIDDGKAILEEQTWLVKELYIDEGYKCFIASDTKQEIRLQEIDFTGRKAF